MFAVIPLLYNGSSRIGLLTLTRVRPFNSEVHSVSALLPCLHHSGFDTDFVLLNQRLGSLKIALKRTRPRQRIYYVGRYSMTEGGGCQGHTIRISPRYKSITLYNESQRSSKPVKSWKQRCRINIH
jgi:hypothetical protein